MLINLSNHPKENWQSKQLKSAKKLYGKIIDIQFPKVDPKASGKEVAELAQKYASKIIKLFSKSANGNNAVHIMGEFTFTYNMVCLMNKAKIDSILSTSERIVLKTENGIKESVFKFVAFRSYNTSDFHDIK